MTQETIEQPGNDCSIPFFYALAQTIAEMALGLGDDGKICYATPSAARITGYLPEHLLTTTLNQLLHEADVAVVNNFIANLASDSNQCPSLEFRVRHADGNFLWMEGTVAVVPRAAHYGNKILVARDITRQKLAEERLYASELRMKSLIENSHDGIALMSPEGKMVYLSSAVKRTLGFAAAELLGTDPRLLSHPDDLAPVAVILENLLPRFGETAVAEYRMRHKNGEWVWVKSNITNLLHEEHIKAFVFNYENITERKNREALIQQSERMMADAQKIAKFGSWELDLTAKGGFGKLRWSDEVFRIFGHAPGGIDVSVEKFYSSVYEEDLPKVQYEMAKALRENSRYSVDHRVVLPDGNIRWVHEDAQLMTDGATGRVNKVLGTVQDITARREAEDRALIYEANLRTIFDNTEIGYAMLDKNFNIVTFNPQAQKWISFAFGEVLHQGDFFLGYIKDNTESARLKVLLKKVLDGENIKFDYHHKAAKAGETWYIVRMNPIVGLDQNVHGICIAMSDITLRKQQEIEREKITADLIQRNKDLEQFAYVISHNLRAPLTNIMGLAQLQLEYDHADEEQSLYIKQLALSVQKMDAIIKDLNHVLRARKEIGEAKQTVYFSQLVADIKQSIEYTLKREDATITTDFTELNEFVTVRSYMHSIFHNLITNGIKYRQADVAPVITISCTVQANKIELVFSDNGLGIDLKSKGKEVFGLYKRFHHHVEGKGMGLFMVKTHVDALGGNISIESEVNKGTKFIVRFPVAG